MATLAGRTLNGQPFLITVATATVSDVITSDTYPISDHTDASVAITPTATTIWVGQGMAAAHPGEGVETFAEAKAILVNDTLALRTVNIVANADPDYYADDNGVRTNDYSLRFAVQGPLNIVGIANGGVSRPRLGGLVGASTGGGGLLGDGFLTVGDGDVTISNIEMSYCKNGQSDNTAGSGTAGIRKINGTTGNLTIDSCVFSNCDDTINLVGNFPGSATITNNDFTGSGPSHSGNGFNCNVIIGTPASLTFTGNTGHTNSTGYDLQQAATTSTVNSNTMV